MIFGPNIIGVVTSIDETENANSGAFRRKGTTAGNLGSGGEWPGDQADFNASWSNAMFGKSSTVQPASYRRYHLIKW